MHSAAACWVCPLQQRDAFRRQAGRRSQESGEGLQVQFGPQAGLQTTLEPNSRWVADVQLPALPDPPPVRPGLHADVSPS